MAMMVETQLERYTLETELDQTNWATLYRARRKTDGAPVIVKIVAPLFTTDEFFVRRFKQITEQVAGLEHPNIVRSYPAESEGNLLYLVQDEAASPTLERIIAAEGPFSPRRAEFIVAQIAYALDYAHQTAVMHGDLSAQQVTLGPEDRVLITDFGLAQTLYGANLAKNAYAGGAPVTLAPERAYGQGPSRSADLYSLGILCYQMLAKEPPFSGPPSMVLHAQAYRQPRPLHRVNPGIPIAVSETVGRMISKGVELRYNTGVEFARALGVACQRQKSLHSYENLMPLSEREQRRSLNPKALVQLASAMVISLAVISLALWAGYELGLNQALAGFAGPNWSNGLAAPVVSPLQPSGSLADQLTQATSIPTPPQLRSSTTVIGTPTSETLAASLSDTLLPPRTPTRDRLLPARTPTPTLTPTTQAASRSAGASPPTPAPSIPTSQGLLIFHNPTGHDLVIDLTGPTNTSVVVPPYGNQEFSLESGPYQAIMHTLTGDFIPSRTIAFDIAPGQIIERDYYSDFDPREFEQQ
jgi:serine/threonine protein kinase